MLAISLIEAMVRPTPWIASVARPVAPLPPLIFSPQKMLLNLWPRSLFLGQAMLRGRSGWRNCSENIVFLAVFPRIDRLHVPIYPPQSPACSLCCLLVRRRRELFPRRRRQCLLFPRLSSALHGRSTPMSPRMNNNTSPPPSFSHHHARRSALRRRRRTHQPYRRPLNHSVPTWVSIDDPNWMPATVLRPGCLLSNHLRTSSDGMYTFGRSNQMCACC